MKRLWIVIAGIVMLTGCASPRLNNAEMAALIDEFIAEEKLERDHTVSAFRLDNYGVLSDEYLTFRSAPSRHYLIKLMPRCSELNFSIGLLLHRRFGNSLSEGTDFVYVPDSLPFKCYINKIYPLTREQHDALKDKIKSEIKERELKEQPLESQTSETSE